MSSYIIDLDPDCELSLTDIHHSVESVLADIKQKHQQADAILGDLNYLKRVTTNVLEPLNEKNGLPKIATIQHLKSLLASCSRGHSTSPEGRPKACSSGKLPTRLNKLHLQPRPLTEGSVDVNVAEKPFSLPPLEPRACATNQFGFPSSGKDLAASGAPATKPVQHTAKRNQRLQRQKGMRENSLRIHCDMSGIKCHELNRFLDDVERATCLLQGTFSAFTQRVLVPLQTFCKQNSKSTTMQRKAKELYKTTPNDNERADTPQMKQTSDQNEFKIVQLMNNIRQLLWPSDTTGLPVHLFSDEHFSKKIEMEISCNKFPIIRVVPDVLQKFNTVLSLATTWLKRDILYVQNAKAALHRAHRRYLKTENLWQQARDSQRSLRGEWDSVFNELQSHTIRLHSLEDDVKQLKEELDESRSTKKTLEIKLRSTDDNIDKLRAKHRSLRKRIIVLSTKLEARERSHGFLESRVLSLKADQEAISEKLRISEEYSKNLQDKMEELYGARDAWSRRYEDKTNSEKLTSRLQQARLRMPLPSLREKTFILRTRMQNLREALDVVERRLNSNEVHWSTLCAELSWPEQICPERLHLPLITQSNRKSENMKPISDNKYHSEGEESTCSSASSSNQQTDDKTSGLDIPPSSKVQDHITSLFPNDERRQLGFMLHFWLEQNGENATVEKLLRALHASDAPSIADSVERHVK